MSGSKLGPRNFLGWANDKIAFALCAFAGLRAGEVSALRWENVNLEKAQIKIVDDVGSNSRVDGLKPPKSKAGVRTVPICQFLYDWLLDHAHAERDALDHIGYKHIGTREGFVIKNAKHPDSPKPPDAGKITASHRQLMLDARLVGPDGDIKFSTHKLRHWQISMAFRLGINTMKISKRAGHGDPSTTTDIYGHVLPDDDDDHPSEVPLIWKERFARAKPDSGLPRIIDGTINGSSVLDLQAEEVSSVIIPDNAQAYVPLALKMFLGGWKVNQVSKHLGQSNSTIFRAFKKAGLPPPNTSSNRLANAVTKN